MVKEEKDFVYDYLEKENNPIYNLTKAAEELTELATALLQRVNKGADKVPDSKIVEEIGDVKIRMKVLEKIFSKDSIDNRVNKKLTVFQDYIKTERFKNI